MITDKFIRSTKVNGKTAIIYLLPASQGLAIAQQISSLILPTVGTVANGAQEGFGVDYQDAAITLTANLGEFEIIEAVKSLLSGLTIDNKEEDFDTYFMGNYGELTDIVAFAVKENFSSFFTKGGFLEKYLPKTNPPE